MRLFCQQFLMLITFSGSGRAVLSAFDPVDDLEARAAYDRLCTEEHHTYFVPYPPVPVPEHEIHFPWGISMRFQASKEELAVEIYYSLNVKIEYPKISNVTKFGMFTKSYDGKYWVYSDLFLKPRPRADLYYWLSLYVTNGTEYKFIKQNYVLTAKGFNKPKGLEAANFELHKTFDRILAQEGDLHGRYTGVKKFRC